MAFENILSKPAEKVQKKNTISAMKEGKRSPSRSDALYSAKLNLHALKRL